MLQLGFLTRGAVVKGKIYHLDNIVFGPALVRAVALERAAQQPRILFDRDSIIEMPTWDMRSDAVPADRIAPIRCAIYTRKSSEEALEQSFNSLDAQREACTAYIASQRHEGWKLVNTHYDDGGYSGGTLERPALTRLLQFNTTTSMGRLTLNVLLSFAQFEREVTGERIRDKIAASKKKGMWMGGMVPLGYNIKDRRLTTDPVETELVGRIYRRYLDLGCVAKLKAELDAQDARSKVRVSAKGIKTGGHPFSRGALYMILQNRIYLGEIAHKGQSYPGEHESIVAQDLWEAVQARLKGNCQARRNGTKARESSLLAGLIYDGNGHRLTPSHAVKNGKRYR